MVGSGLRSPYGVILDNRCSLESATFNFLSGRISQQDVRGDLSLTAINLAVDSMLSLLRVLF